MRQMTVGVTMNLKRKMNMMENPWDGGDGSWLGRILYTAGFCLLTALLVGVPAVQLTAQVLLPPPVEEVETSKTSLTPDEIALAEDYCGLLDRLEKTSTDYVKYLSTFNNLYAQKSQKQLLTLLVNIKTETYCIDVETLIDDLDNIIADLEDYEDEVSAQDEKKLYRLIKKLRFEIQLIQELLEEDIASNLNESETSLTALTNYIKKEREENILRVPYEKSVALLADDLRIKLEHKQDQAEEFKIQLTDEQLEQIDEALKLTKELVAVITMEIQDSDIPMPPDAPDAPGLQELEVKLEAMEKAREAFESKVEAQADAYSFTYKYGKTGVSREYVDSMHIISSHTPIYINNKSGDVEISGWDKNLVKVVYEIEVIAENNDMANDLIDEISLNLTTADNTVYLQADIPSLSDPRRKILKSQMIVVVPSNNKVICENAFGDTFVKNIKKHVSIKTNNSDVYLKNIKGGLDASVTNGTISGSLLRDTINIVNKLGEVILKECRGYFTIDNSYSPVELIACTGPAKITNNSEVTVTNHDGDVDITNANAQIDIDKIQGNLTAVTSFKPLYINGINGSINVTNNNALINVRGITGNFAAFNTSGQIIARDLNGPISITNNNGTTSLTLPQQFRGPSNILSNYGTINLTVNKNSDLLLNNLVEGGVVRSNIHKASGKDASTTTFAFGNGSEKLDINGVSTTIVINQTE